MSRPPSDAYVHGGMATFWMLGDDFGDAGRPDSGEVDVVRVTTGD